MATILERLPNPSALDSELTPILNKFGSLTSKAQGFSSGDLQSVLAGAGNLPIPNNFALVSTTLSKFGEMASQIPTHPEEVTAALRQGLEQLKTNSSGLGNLLEPIGTTLDLMAPLLEKFEFLTNSVTRINTLVSGLSDRVENLNLANLPEQIEYFSRVFDVFPEANDVSPFKELKAQVDTLKAWLSSNTANLTQQFQNQIQSLANALPTQLNNAMEEGLDALTRIEASLAELDTHLWLDPYNQALAAVEGMDLRDLSQIDSYLTVLNAQVSTVTAIVTPLPQKTQMALDELERFDVNLFAQNLQDALQNIFNTINPETPSVLAGLFRQIEKLVGGLEVGRVQSTVQQIGEQIDQYIGQVDFSTLTAQIEAIATQITSTIEIVERELVTVATFLSNLVNELQSAIGSVNLPALLNQVQGEFNLLSNQVNGLVSQVTIIPQQIENLVNDLGTEVSNLNLKALKEAIANLLGEITSVLNDPQIQKIRQEAQQGIEAIAQNLASVSLKTVFDRVIGEIDEVKTKLASADVSQINDILKLALKAALEAITSIDFPQEVAEVLKQQFQDILNRSTGLLEPLQEKYQEIVAQIEQFSPGTWVAKNLAPPFEALLKELEKIEPAKLLNPLKTLSDSLLKLLDPLSPNTLLSPLTDLHSRLLSALNSLSPRDLIAPLNQLLSQVTSLLEQLGIEAFISKITDSVGKINTLIGNLSVSDQLPTTDFWTTLNQLQLQGNSLLQDAESQLDRYLDELIDFIPPVDITVLEPALAQLSQAIATIENHAINPAMLTRLHSITATLKAQPFRIGVTDLTKRWLAQKARFANITPAPEFKQTYETLQARLQALSPIQLLSVPVTLVDTFTTRLATVEADLGITQQSLKNLLAKNREHLTALLPKEATAAGFKQLLRDGLLEQIGEPAKALLQVLRQKLAQFEPVLAAIKAIALKFQAPTQALTVIPASIGRIGDALIDAKQKITGVNLDFLEDELQGVIDEIIAQFSSINPAVLLSSLDTTYKNMLNVLKQLYPEAAILSLDKTYQDKVLKKLQDLHPAKTIAPPLDEEYKKILELQKELSVDKIFDALTKKLDTLSQELDDGLERAAKAFEELIQEAESLGSSITLSVSIDIF